MRNVIILTTSAIAVTGVIASRIKASSAAKAAARKQASKEAMAAKAKRAAEVSRQVAKDKREAEHLEWVVERAAYLVTPEGKLCEQLSKAERRMGIKKVFDNKATMEEVISLAALHGYAIEDAYTPAFIAVVIKARELHPDWSEEQCVEAGKIAAQVMQVLGVNYHPDVVFGVADDFARFELLNKGNVPYVINLIVMYAKK